MHFWGQIPLLSFNSLRADVIYGWSLDPLLTSEWTNSRFAGSSAYGFHDCMHNITYLK